MTDQTHATSRTVLLPAGLAPSQAERIMRLLSEVRTTVAPELVAEAHTYAHRCVVCHQSGKLGGHHGADGRIEGIHRKCHRRLHRSGRHISVIPSQRRFRSAA